MPDGVECVKRLGSPMCRQCDEGVTVRDHSFAWASHRTNPREWVQVEQHHCPRCKQLVITAYRREHVSGASGSAAVGPVVLTIPVYPATPNGRPIPSRLLAENEGAALDYEEAWRISTVSPRGSAALSRRCVQQVLESRFEAKKSANLEQQIKASMAAGHVPEELGGKLQNVRRLGNGAVHPRVEKGVVLHPDREDSPTADVPVVVNERDARWMLAVVGELIRHAYPGEDS